MMGTRIGDTAFDNFETLLLGECALIALQDADMFDDLADTLDLSDAYMTEFREKLQRALPEGR